MKTLKKVINLVNISPRMNVQNQLQLSVRDIAATATVGIQLIIVNPIIFWANIVKRRITAMNQQ